MDSKITNPFEVIDARLARIEVLDARLTRIEELLTRLTGQKSTGAALPDPNQEEYMSRREVADLYDVCLTTVDNLSNAGVLRKYRSGRVVRFLRSEVIAAMSGDKCPAFFRHPKNQK